MAKLKAEDRPHKSPDAPAGWVTTAAELEAEEKRQAPKPTDGEYRRVERAKK